MFISNLTAIKQPVDMGLVQFPQRQENDVNVIIIQGALKQSKFHALHPINTIIAQKRNM